MQKTTFVSLILLFLAITSQQAQQAQNPPQQTGSIEGIVLKFGPTDPVARARVQLRPANNPNSQIITADDAGKFAFRDLAPGQYRVTVTRDGYAQAEYGQRSPTSSGVPITLASQQQFRDAKISMVPAGTISGRILNRYGEPAGNVNVQAMRYTYQDGRRTLTTTQTIRTNDLGEYRLFWMTPGQYIISAQGTDPVSVNPGETVMFQTARGAGGPGGLAAGLGAQLGVGGVTQIMITGGNGPGGAAGRGAAPAPPPLNVVDDANLSLPVYYPGTTDVTTATAVDLRAGGNVGGVNLTLVEAKPLKIRGQVLSGGRPAAGAQVSLMLRTSIGGVMNVRTATVNNDTGAFEFRNVAPGGYELIATLNGFGPAAMMMNSPLGAAAGVAAPNIVVGRGGARNPDAPVMGARVPVDLVSADVEAVSLLLETGFNVGGRVSISGQTSSNDVSGVRIQLQSDPQIPPLALPAVTPEADGTFSVAGVTPGTYRLSVAALPQNTYLKSARLGGVDILNGGLKIDSAPNGALDIVLGTTPGILDATVVDDRQLPVAAVTVALVPDAAQQKRYDVYRTATSDSAGRIHLTNVVPGDYRIFAWESVENGAWTDPDFMRAYQNNGTAVHVGEGGQATTNVRLIPYRAN